MLRNTLYQQKQHLGRAMMSTHSVSSRAEPFFGRSEGSRVQPARPPSETPFAPARLELSDIHSRNLK
jgi:hypothetical protein